MTALLDLGVWVPILDGDPVAAAMYDRHYSSERSRQRRADRGTLQFGGPGNRMILMTPCRRALWVWRRHKHRKDAETGVECSIFRNEGAGLGVDAGARRRRDRRSPIGGGRAFVTSRSSTSPRSAATRRVTASSMRVGAIALPTTANRCEARSAAC